MPNIEVISAESKHVVAEIRKIQDVTEAKRSSGWVSPLDIAFSQNVIYPRFSDGRCVDEAVGMISAVCACPDGAAEGEFDITLTAPFPRIDVVRWRPKLRDGEGRPLLDEFNNTRYGLETLCTLDNRRLYALQRVAVAEYPRRCGVYVRHITAQSEIMRHVKKFRTRTNGLSVSISEWNGVGRDNAKNFAVMRVWDWRSAISGAVLSAKGGKEVSIGEAVGSGSCGSWQYLDNKGVRRGPFSHWQMRQWWEQKMLPDTLKIRAYDAEVATSLATPGQEDDESDFRTVLEVFEDAVEPFAMGWSPPAAKAVEASQWKKCGQCTRDRLEGWTAHGQWYCSACWVKWEARGA